MRGEQKNEAGFRVEGNGWNRSLGCIRWRGPLHSETVDRCAVAKYIVDSITGADELDKNASVGITN